ncbi:Cna B-type domain-containing protein [Streptococcus parasanguinis]|uniref:Cna B-type domain-containing protein n=1 Tax=Streptococcus parasanguinis TaxID=1318 RepID=UPI001CC17577|nr:Cna B-type domain-containing protein [Streptococcus parasanguinis]MBZ2090012.1 Cna B-type domain-containing protein [Streptococcus parasanguinis]
MKKLRSLWKDFLKKGFAILTIFMMLGQLGQGAITAFANELAVGDNGALDVTLMYGDKQDHPGGMSYYTGDTMSGYIQITPKNLTTDINEVTVTLNIPGKYLREVSIPDFNSASAHDKPTVTKVGDDYQVTLRFNNYQKSEVLTLPFIGKFKLGYAPTNYSLDITGTLNINGQETKLNDIIWKPKYNDYRLTKYINQNLNEAMSKDYAEAMPGVVKGADGKNYIETPSSVPFAFQLEGMQGQYEGQYRQLESATITDKLPTYTDKNGNTRTAVLDTAKSEGWVDNGDGTVSKTFTAVANDNPATYHIDLMTQIKNSSYLYLKFPDLVLEKDQTLKDVLSKDLTNAGSVVGIPANRGEGEPDITAEDSLIFRLTSRDLEGAGSFAKKADGDVYDSTEYKAANYKWIIAFDNKTPSPQKNFVFYDETVDSRLKFTKIDYARLMQGNYGNGEFVSKYVKRLILTLDDGSKKKIQPETDKDGNGLIDLTKYGTVVGWRMEMKDDFVLQSGQGIRLNTYTSFKDPEKTRYDENDATKNEFKNTGRVTYQTQSNVAKDQTSNWTFKLIPLKESFEISKTTDYNNVRYTDGQNIRFGLMATKVVLDPDKDYGDLRIIDLYDPNTLKVDYKDFERNLASNEKGMKFLKSYDVIENYHNSGRTALIMHLDQKEFIKASLKDLNRVRLPFIVADLKGKDDGGTFTNKVYVAGNGIHDLENANPDRVTEDVYDLNGNGSTTDKIPYAQSNYTIVAAEGIYARKYIAKNDDLSDASIVTRTFKPGETFNYKLTIKNNTDKAVEDGVVYDVLPKVKDVNTLDGSGRMTEYTVSLRGPVTAPEGWTVYYTTDTGVTTDTMAQAADKDIWTTAVADYSQVTGIKLVANQGVSISARGEASFGVPVVNPSELTDEVKALMQERTKDNEDNGGRSGLVQAHNQFGYKAKGHEGNRESNTVTAQIFSAAFQVKKVDKEDSKKVLEGAEFTLTDANGAVVATATSDKNGELSFNTLTEGTYTLKETKAPENYKLDETEHAVVVTYDADKQIYHVTVDGKAVGSKAVPVEIANEADIKYLDLEASKVWDDQDNQEGLRPASVEFQLYKNGKAQGKPVAVSAATDWKAHFTNLPDKDSDGKLITYTVKEVKVPTHYTVDTEEASFTDGKATITNKRTPETTTVTVKKVWDDAQNQDGLRPSTIKVHLLANGTEVQALDLTGEGDEWTHTFTDLPVYKDGQKVVYTVTEDKVDNYTTKIDGTTITNTYKPGKTSLTVTKNWNDANDQDGLRPKSIKVQLYAGDEKVGKAVELSADNKWTHTFSNLDEKKAGQVINYTVKEIDVPEGYTQAVEATNPGQVVVTNTHTPEKTKVEVSKKWEDGDNQDGIRPANIQVQLYKDGLPTDQVLELSAANDWKGAFENLDAKAAGKAIAYTVKEVTVPDGYKVTVNDKDKANVVLTNTHEPALTEMKVTKKWEDANNQDGLRPKSIKVQLYAGDEKVGDPVELSAENQWTHTFSKLAEKKAGQAISYRVEEVDVPEGYQVTADTSDPAHTILTNTHTPEVIDIPVTKIWNDHDNQDGLRPDRIVVKLLANGNEVAQKELTNATDWKESFTGLPKFNDGKEIVYTLQELKVDNYMPVIDQATYTITNTHAPGKRSISVTKKWDDENDKDGIRPKSVQVQLYAGDEKVEDPVELSADNKWTHIFADLDEKSNGNTITYTVREVNVPKGYEVIKAEDGQGNVVITNKHVPKQPTPPSSPEPKNPGQSEPKNPSQPEPKKPGKILGFLPNTGTTISIISLVLAFVLASIAAYILKKKKK